MVLSETGFMQKHIRLYLLFILCTFFIMPIHAQKRGYSQGYIINLEGETITGAVKDRSTGMFIDLYKKIRFKPENAFVRRSYGPDEILGYGSNDQHYESVPLVEESEFFKFRYYLRPGSEMVFLRIISGNNHLTYYHWEYLDGDSNYLDYIPLLHRSGSLEMVRVTQGVLGLKRKRLTEYFWDCPEMISAVNRKQLNEISEVYNFYLEHYIDVVK